MCCSVYDISGSSTTSAGGLRAAASGRCGRACQSARPRPVAASTSQARCTRIGLLRSIRAKVSGIERGQHARRGRRRRAAPRSARAASAGSRDLGEAFGQRAEIEAGAADDDRPQPGGARRRRAPRRRRAASRRPNSASRRRRGRRAVRRAGEIGVVGTRGQDAPAGVDLAGVGVDHAAAVALGERQRQRRLAAGGRPGDQHRAAVRHLCNIILIIRDTASPPGSRRSCPRRLTRRTKSLCNARGVRTTESQGDDHGRSDHQWQAGASGGAGPGARGPRRTPEPPRVPGDGDGARRHRTGGLRHARACRRRRAPRKPARPAASSRSPCR